MKHLSNWIEIPVKDIKRATRFYESLLKTKLQPMELGPIAYALFPSEDTYNAGALACGEGYEPATGGITVYLDGGKELEALLERAGANGGQIVMPKTYLGKEAGYIGFFLDSEGNKIGLQSAE